MSWMSQHRWPLLAGSLSLAMTLALPALSVAARSSRSRRTIALLPRCTARRARDATGRTAAACRRARRPFRCPCRISRTATSPSASPMATGSRSSTMAARPAGSIPLMPAFGEALPDADLELALAHVRTFCADRTAWPGGNLNLPRTLFTEKAFVEDEVVVTASIAAEGDPNIASKVVYEKRFFSKGQFELVVPLGFKQPEGQDWTTGLGDVVLGWKQVLFHSLASGSILAASGEIILPIGDEGGGFGKGVTVFEPFVSFGQVLRGDSFIQAQAGIELPTDTGKAAQEAFWRVAAGKSFAQHRWGRTWSPMIELLGFKRTRGRPGGALRPGAAVPGDAEHAPAHHGERRRSHPARQAAARAAPNSRSTCCGTGSTAGSRTVGRGGDDEAPRIAWLSCAAVASVDAPRADGARHRPAGRGRHGQPAARTFDTSDSCHGLPQRPGHAHRARTSSIGIAWRASMMANAARDPYWQAGVRREITGSSRRGGGDRARVLRLPHADAARTRPRPAGSSASVFAHLPIGRRRDRRARAGRRRRLVHGLPPDRARQARRRARASTRRLRRRRPCPGRPPRGFGPYDVDAGRARVDALGHAVHADRRPRTSRSPSSARPATRCSPTRSAPTARSSASCRSRCRTWSGGTARYAKEKSCQSCHMRPSPEPMTIAIVLGQPREGVRRHEFRGGNFFMPRMLNRYRDELGVTALPQELDAAALRADEYLRDEAATLSVDGARASRRPR